LLDDVALAVRPGEVLAVVGPNGAGKSTLLRVLCGELLPQSGEVRLVGRELRNWPARERARKLAVLPQQSRLEFGFLAEEVVGMGRSPHAPRAGDERIVQTAMERVGVSHLAGRVYPTLSGGEQQQVQLARVLAQETGFILLDEPTSSLDLRHQHQVLRLLRELAKEDVGIMVVLHDLRLAKRYADRIAMMQQGQILAMGAVGHVLTASIVATVYDLDMETAVETVTIGEK
jgi:iron complex transport system ATP-binding protein